MKSKLSYTILVRNSVFFVSSLYLCYKANSTSLAFLLALPIATVLFFCSSCLVLCSLDMLSSLYACTYEWMN